MHLSIQLIAVIIKNITRNLKLEILFSAFNNICVEGIFLGLKLNIAGWGSLVARRAHKTHLKFGSLLALI